MRPCAFKIFLYTNLLRGRVVSFPGKKVKDLLITWINLINIILNTFHHSQSPHPAVYILSGTLPIEAMIHQRVLTFFGNISRLPESSVENQLAVRQLAVMTLDSSSCFVAVRKLCTMYGLSDYVDLLD